MFRYIIFISTAILIYIYIYIYIYISVCRWQYVLPTPGVEQFRKGITVTTCVMQSYSNELSSRSPLSVYIYVCIYIRIHNSLSLSLSLYIYTNKNDTLVLKSLHLRWVFCWLYGRISGWPKIIKVSNPTSSISCVKPHRWVVTQGNILFMEEYINILKWIGPRRDLYSVKIYLFISFLHTCIFPACCFRQRTYMAPLRKQRVENINAFKNEISK